MNCVEPKSSMSSNLFSLIYFCNHRFSSVKENICSEEPISKVPLYSGWTVCTHTVRERDHIVWEVSPEVYPTRALRVLKFSFIDELVRSNCRRLLYGGRLSDATDPSMVLHRRYKVTPTSHLCIGVVLADWLMPFTRQLYSDRYSISVFQKEQGWGMPADGS